MTRLVTLFAACAVLAACGDPLKDVDRLSSVELADDAVSVGALPDPAEVAAPKGLFSNLFPSRDTAVATAPVVASDAANAQTIDTSGAVDAALTDASAAPAAANVAAQTAPVLPATPAPKKRGLFGWGRAKPDAPVVTVTTTQTLPTPDAAPVVDTAAAPAAPIEAPTAQVAPETAVKPRKGLFGRLAGARAKEAATANGATVRTASLGPVAGAANTNTRQKQTAFKGRNRKHKGPDVQIVPFGTALPAGAIARVCDLPNGRLGKEVDKFPERGRGYKIFDSNPSGSGTRPFYVTGFDDKCARTFTAALALFGSPNLHEQLRYGLPSSKQPYSSTDEAYEGVKRSVCGVGKKKPCGAKITQLEKNTAFISIYDRIGSNSKWSNILLHKGWVLAADRKG